MTSRSDTYTVKEFLEDYIGTAPEISNKLGITSEAVYRWFRKDRVPAKYYPGLIKIAHDNGFTGFTRQDLLYGFSGQMSKTQMKVAEAKRLAEKFSKDIIIIIAWDECTGETQITTYGNHTNHKIYAKQAGDTIATSLNLNLEEMTEYENYLKGLVD